MKNIYLLITLLIGSFSFAQISDTDAKIIYQQAEDLYNQSNYYDASQKALQLKEKMGSWTPKVLYLHLKSAYKNYTESNQKSQRIYSKDYKTFSGFVELSDTFFGLIDKASYPQEKYKEIETLKEYFINTQNQYKNTLDRTPKDAIDFLNECGKRFPKKSTESDNLWGRYEIMANSVQFSLEDKFLKISKIMKRKEKHFPKSNDEFHGKIMFIDLSQVGKIGFNSQDYKNKAYKTYFLDGKRINRHHDDGRNIFDYEVIEGCIEYNIFGWEETNTFNKINAVSAKDAFNDWTQTTFSITDFPDADQNFDTSSNEFRNGDYIERIKDAFQFLIEYFGGGTPIENKQNNQEKGKF